MKASKPYQLVLIDENGKQMLSMETDQPFTQADFTQVNKAIERGTIDEEQAAGGWLFA